jgi:hypothetical protein
MLFTWVSKWGISRIGLQAHTNDPLSDATDNTTRHKDVLCHDEIREPSQGKEWLWQTRSPVAAKKNSMDLGFNLFRICQTGLR